MEQSPKKLVQQLLDRKKELLDVTIPSVEKEIKEVESTIATMKKECNHVLCRTDGDRCKCIACGYVGFTFPDGSCFDSVCIVGNSKAYNVYKNADVIPEDKKCHTRSYKWSMTKQEDRLSLLKSNLKKYRALAEQIDEELYSALELICASLGLKYERDIPKYSPIDLAYD